MAVGDVLPRRHDRRLDRPATPSRTSAVAVVVAAAAALAAATATAASAS